MVCTIGFGWIALLVICWAQAPNPGQFGFAVGEYYDVVAMPLAEQAGTFKVRFRPADFTGDANVVVHCHLLAHEDGGMMLVTSILP